MRFNPHSGRITFALFMALTPVFLLTLFSAPHASAADEQRARDPEEIFRRRDANGDGHLTIEEFKQGMKESGQAKADTRFKKLDTSGDSKLSLEEFKAGMKAGGRKQGRKK